MSAYGADPNTPAIISPTSTPYMLSNGIAPNGITASLANGVFFTQPYVDGLQPRAVYSITTAGAVSTTFAIPTNGADSTENGVAVAQASNAGGFTAGDVFATGATGNLSCSFHDAIYKNGVVWKDCLLPAALSQHQSTLAFDTVGSFGGNLIATADNMIFVIDKNAVVQKTFIAPTPAGFSYVLQDSTVAPTTYSPCAGCLLTTAMDSANINHFPPSANPGAILSVLPSALNNSTASVFATTTFPEPESIQFVSANALSCNIGGFSYFASGYATDNQMNTRTPIDGAVLAWTPAQLNPFVGKFLVQNEEDKDAGGHLIHGTIYVFDATGSPQFTVFSDTTTGTNAVGYQLEDTAILQCPQQQPPPGGCPATQGFWHKAGNWPNVTASFDGITYNGATDHSMVIGGVTYSQTQLLSLMPSGKNHPGNFGNSLSQLIAAILNIAAGAQHPPSTGVDAAIIADNAALTGVHLFQDGTTNPAVIPSSVVAAVEANLDTLDAYNSATGLGCSEGSGLNTGSGKN
jgi:hypothetical protein